MTGTLASDRRLLCEGWLEEWADGEDNLVMYPRVAYVVQDAKVWFAQGDGTMLGEALDTLLESEGGPRVVVESAEEMELEERQLSDGTKVKIPKGSWYVEGVFQRSDVPNANKRKYPRAIWDKLIADDASYVQKNIGERAMLGHLEHPKDGRTDGKEGAIVTVAAKLQEDGTVWGRAEVLDTPNGLILKEYTKKNVRWGVSSRGNGTVGDDGTVDPDSFVFETWDAVMKPSVPGAFPTVPKQVKEDEEGGEATDEARGKDAKSAYAARKKEIAGLLRTLQAKLKQHEQKFTAEGGRNWGYVGDLGQAAEQLREIMILNESHTDGQGSSATVTEADEFAVEVSQLVETPLDDIDPFLRSSLRAKIAQATERGSALQGEGKLHTEQALSLQRMLTRYSLGLLESEDGDLDAAIDDAIRQASAAGEEDRVDGFAQVTESLREQLRDAIAEAGHLRERLEVAESATGTAEGQLDVVIEQLAEVEGKLETTASKLKLAEELLATRPESQRSEAVTATVDRVIGEVSSLERFRDILLLGRDAAHVEQIAERLLPAAVRPVVESHDEPDVAEGGSSATRRTLPSRVVIESDDVEPPPDTEDTPKERPRQVTVAEGALKAMKGRTAVAEG